MEEKRGNGGGKIDRPSVCATEEPIHQLSDLNTTNNKQHSQQLLKTTTGHLQN